MKQPKEVAEELIDKMYAEMKWFSRGCAKKCALICCDEIIKELQFHWEQFDKLEMHGSYNSINAQIEYWQAVKKELIK